MKYILAFLASISLAHATVKPETPPADPQQVQTQAQQQHQEQSQNSTSQANNQNNTGNAQTLSVNHVRNAPSVALGAIYPTANCQAGVGLGGSGVNGSGLLSFSFSKQECETILLAQNFAALGMADTSCDILKTTKAFKRAVKANAALKDIPCVAKAPPVLVAPPACPPNDNSKCITGEQFDRAFKSRLDK